MFIFKGTANILNNLTYHEWIIILKFIGIRYFNFITFVLSTNSHLKFHFEELFLPLVKYLHFAVKHS